MIGKTILHYKIIEKLGEGGMGVVYKAEDTKLERTVALKFLSLTSIGDEEKKRFKREAKAAASLNHPNIATIHAIDEADDQTFIAMEFVEGESLQEIVGANGGSPMPINKAIDYATQIAAGLQAAHEKGIIHRDIKSANIMVTDKSVVKIMDFGLAKLTNRSKMTMAGSTLGTAAYMSPQQAQGEEVDHRADIWSLGVVLYEMISGQLPFKGDYEQAVIYSILNEDPEPLTALRTGVPMALDGIIAKALAKDADTRYQHVDELPADLRAIDSISVSRSRISTQIPHTKSKHKRGRWLPWGVAAVLFLAFLVIALIHFRETPEEAQPVRFTIPIPESLTSVGTGSISSVISPDGRRIVFTGTDTSGVTSIWMRPLDATEARPIAGTEDVVRIQFWSPDSRFIVYSNFKGKLVKIPAAGGPTQNIVGIPLVTRFFSGSWGKGGTILYSSSSEVGIYHIPATGGTPTRVTTIDTAKGEVRHEFPQFLPDGRHFLHTVDTGEESGIYVASLDSRQGKRILSGASQASYISPGYLLYLRGRTHMVQPFDASSFELSGEPVAIFDEDRYDIWVSQTGVMVYQNETSNRQLILFDRRGTRLSKVGEDRFYVQIALSPDEKRLAASIGPSVLQSEISIADLDRAVFSRFTTGTDPIWSPDGSRLLFISDYNLMVKNLLSGQEDVLLDAPELVFVDDWTQDGRYALCHIMKGGSEAVWAVPLSGDPKPMLLLEGSFRFDEPQVSPDGRWLAYIAYETGRFEIYVQPFLATGERIRISTDGGGQPRWRKDGKELFYLSLDGRLMAADIEGGEAIKASIPKQLFKVPVTVDPGLDQFVVTGDGQRFIVIVEAEEAPSPVHVILNWPEALLKR